MKVNQTTAALDDTLNDEGCALLSAMLLAELAGRPEYESADEVNGEFIILKEKKDKQGRAIVREDALIQNWQALGDYLFGEGVMRFHWEGPSYVLKPGDFAVAWWQRIDDKGKIHTHFLAAYPKEIDPWPNSRTRREGQLVGYRVFTKVKKEVENG